MPVRVPHPRSSLARRLVLLALCGLIVLPAPSARAGEAGARDQDPAVVVVRRVQPRIAYRGVPLEDHPIAAQATTFPVRVFRDTMGGVVESLVDDAVLDEHAAAGPAVVAVSSMLERSLAPLGPTLAGQAAGSTPFGPSPTSTGGVGGATGSLGSLVGSTLVPATGAQGGGR
jgi:hypothetical protein